jgi:Mn2+/Fe2+ NRAMP family transporter
MSAESDFQVAAPPRGWERLKVVGPGFILAATGVGAGDLVTSLVAGTRFGTALI